MITTIDCDVIREKSWLIEKKLKKWKTRKIRKYESGNAKDAMRKSHVELSEKCFLELWEDDALGTRECCIAVKFIKRH